MNKWKFLIIGVVVAFCLVAVFGWFFFGRTIREHLSRRPFEATAWQDAKDFKNEARLRMVDDLLRRHRFQNMTREQVTAIVGKPDKTEYFKDWDLVYWLGRERGFIGIGSEWLVFRLDGQQKVTEYKIVKD